MSLITDQTPWHKQFWPWFLLAIPGITIVWCIFMIYLAISGRDPMVTDDYYKDGLAINQELERGQNAKAMGLSALLQLDDAGRINIRLNALLATPLENATAPAYLILKLEHPTQAQKDQTLQVARLGNGLYQVLLDEPIDGRWYLDLRNPDNSWRLKGEWTVQDAKETRLVPATR